MRTNHLKRTVQYTLYRWGITSLVAACLVTAPSVASASVQSVGVGQTSDTVVAESSELSSDQQQESTTSTVSEPAGVSGGAEDSVLPQAAGDSKALLSSEVVSLSKGLSGGSGTDAEQANTSASGDEGAASAAETEPSAIVLGRPKVTSTLEGSSCTLSWGAVPGAKRYAVAKRTDNGWYTYSYSVTGTSFELNQLESGREYQFLVQAYVDGAWSVFDDSDVVTVRYVIEHPHVTATLNGSSCTLSWGAVPGAQRYAVAKWTNAGWYTYTYDATSTHFDLSQLETGIEYRFLVQAQVDGAWSEFGDSDITSVTYVDPTVPTNVKAVPSGDGQVTLTWDAVPGATQYAVAELAPDGSWCTFAYDCTETSFVADDLANGREHRFLVQALVNGSWSPCLERLCVSATPQGTTKPRLVVSPADDGALTLSWDRVPGATRYAVAMGIGSTWKTYTYNYTGTSFALSGLTPQQPYRFLVQAFVDGRWSSFDEDDVVTACPEGTAPSIGQPRVAAWYADGSLHLTWDGIGDADSYTVYRKMKDGSYKNLQSIDADGQEILSCSISNFDDDDRNCDYTLLVQAFRGSEGSAFTDADLVSVFVPGWQLVSNANNNELRLRNAAYAEPATPAGYCAGWVENVYRRAGFGYFQGDACDLYNWYCHSSDVAQLKVGMIVAVSSHSHTPMGRLYGHVGVYIGDGYLRDSAYGTVREFTMREWLDYYGTTVTPKWGWLGNVSVE